MSQVGEGGEPQQDAAAPDALPETPPPESATGSEPDPVRALERQLGERTADLQRLQAEYVNYKRRVDRDRQVVRETATVGVLMGLLPVLDDIDLARAHNELDGGFKAVAESLERIVATLGLERFGEPGESFDPRVHEALTHEFSDSVAEPTATAVLQAGYRVGERIVRPARVAVTEPVAATPDPAADPVADQAPEPSGDPISSDPVSADALLDPEQGDSRTDRQGSTRRR